MATPKPTLANAELALMELLWRSPGLTARELREALYPDTDRAQHGTVQRLLQRLEEKGFLDRDRSLPVHRFSPAIDREAYAGGQLETLAEKLTGGSLAPFLTHMVENDRLSAEEIDRLRAILESSPLEEDEA